MVNEHTYPTDRIRQELRGLLGACFADDRFVFSFFHLFTVQVMSVWPPHNAPLSEAELLLYAWCERQWPDDPYASRPAQQYAAVVSLLNKRFSKTHGLYTVDGVRRYLQKVHHDPRYRTTTGQRRYNQWKDAIAAFAEKEFGPPKRRGRGIDFYAMKDKSTASSSLSSWPCVFSCLDLFLCSCCSVPP